MSTNASIESLAQKPARRRYRIAAAGLIFAVNALLLAVLSLGGSADAKPSAKPGSAVLLEPFDESAPPAKQSAQSQGQGQGTLAKLKTRARKLMPVRDFGGY